MKTACFGSLLIALCFIVSSCPAYAAVGCTLNDPDRDIRSIFPEATGYKTEFITIKEKGGDKLVKEIESKLGDKFDPVYETVDVPYAYYTVLKGKEVIGHVHGVNQKGKFGGIQLILATDTNGAVVGFYYQKISSPEAKKFRNELFTDQFKGITLADFYRHKNLSEKERVQSRIGKIKDPTKKSAEDFAATLRGIMKNLILLDEFKLHRKYYHLVQGEKRHEKTDN